MSRRSGNSYEEVVSNGSSWRDRLTDEHTFEDWQLHKHQIRTMLNTSGSVPIPLHRFEEESNGGFSNITYDHRPPPPHQHSTKSDTKKDRRVRKRVLYTLLGLIGLVAVVIPIVLLLVLLRKSDGGSPESKVATVDLEVSVHNIQFSETLADKESDDYRNFTLQFCQEMETFYKMSSIGSKYDGCLVQELRQGSIIVVFTLVFSSEYLPTDSAVRKVFTDNAAPTQSGTLEVTVGIYVLTESSIVVGEVEVIENDKNPTPRISLGDSCKVKEACKTYQAVCINEKCGCDSSRIHSPGMDSCISLQTTTAPTSPPPTTVPVTTTDLTSSAATSSKTRTTAGPTTVVTTLPTTETVQTTDSTTVTPTSSVSKSTKTVSTLKPTTSSEAETTITADTKDGSTFVTTVLPTETSQSTETSTVSSSTTKLTASTSTKVVTSTEPVTSSESTVLTTTSLPHSTSESTTSSPQSTSKSTTSSSQSTSEAMTSSAQSTSESTNSSPQSTSESTTSSPQSTSESPQSTSESTTSSSQSTSESATSSPQSTTESTTSSPQSKSESTTSAPQSTSESPQSTSASTTSSSQSTPGSSTSSLQSTSESTTSSPQSTSESTTSSPQSTLESATSSQVITSSASPTTDETSTYTSPTSTSASTSGSQTSTTNLSTGSSSTSVTTSTTDTSSTLTTVSSTSSASSSTTSMSSTSSSTSQSSTASETSTSTQATATTSPSSTTASAQTTSTPLTSTSSELPTGSTSGSSQTSISDTFSTARSTATSFTTSVTLPALEVIPVVSLLSPPNRRIEIDTEEEIICQVDNATDWTILTFRKTNPDSSTPRLIGDFTIQNGTSIGASYGPDTDNIWINIFSFDLAVSFNVTVVFKPVLCSDGGRYQCSVTAPGFSHDPIEVSEDIDAYKMPVVQLKFPDELREGLWGLNIGCSATLGAAGALTLMRKRPGEIDFAPFEPQVKNPRELRINETIDPEFPCIKDVLYEFDANLDGWNMTEILCAIDEGKDSEMLSDIGVFKIVPRSVCDGAEARQNIPHPFDCKLYVTCAAEDEFWGYVHRSTCPDDECWLSDGQCGTTTTVTTTSTTITTPTTTITTTTIPPHLPYITCAGNIQSAKVGEDVSYACNLQNVETITQVRVVSSQLEYEQTDEDGLNGTFTGESVTLVVNLDEENQISISLKTVACDMEGEVTIIVNGNLSDTVALRIISDPAEPQLSMPESIYNNQETVITCSGNVGRLKDGSPAVTLGFEIQFQGQNDTIGITNGIVVLSNSTDNCETHITIQFRFQARDVMNSAVLSCVSTDVADQSRLFTDTSGSVTVLAANIFFDKGLEYDVAIGDTLSLTCSFQNLQDVGQLKISRGDNKEDVIALNRDGTVVQALDHFGIASSDWGPDYGSVTINATIQCGDENLYRCEANGHSGIAAVLISVLRRPETPTVTLSYEMIEGQEPWADRLSECKAQIGDPAGVLVVEVLNDGAFQEHDVIYGTGYPQNNSLDCGTEQTIQFYFSDLTGLNNTEIRCAVKPADVFNDTEKLVSDSQIIRTVNSSYCDGVNTSFYVHPYDCHYFVDCNQFPPGVIHFTRCLDQDSCPNPLLGACDVDSCATVCNRATTTTTSPTTTITSTTVPPQLPYIQCGGTVEADLSDAVTIICELGNVDVTTVETVMVYQDDIIIFNETGSSGLASLPDDSITLRYTNEEITIDIAQIQCHQDAVYTVLVNDLLSANSTVVVKTSAERPTITSTRFIAGQLATVTCKGSIGKPKESTTLFVEAWIKLGPFMTDDFAPVPPAFEENKFNSVTCSYERQIDFTIEIQEFMNGIIDFRCRTSTDSGNLTSAIIPLSAGPQEIYIQPPKSEVAVGVTLSIECNITGVSELTSIRFYRESDRLGTICKVTQGAVSGILCSGEVTPTGGRLVMEFSSFQCSDEDIYVCESNPEASTPKQTSLSISEPTQNPIFTSVPRRLVENIGMREDESFTCEADLGYPSAGRLTLQSNKDGEYVSYDDVFGVHKTRIEEECSVLENTTVRYFVFNSSWNNTQLRCVIADENGTATNYVSEEITIQLIPETFCDGQQEFYLHPYDIHLYIRCTENDLFVNTCNDNCSVITDGTLTCEPCDII